MQVHGLDLSVKVERHQKQGKTSLLHPDLQDVKLAQSYSGKLFSIDFTVTVEAYFPAQAKLTEQRVTILNKPFSFQKSKAHLMNKEQQDSSKYEGDSKFESSKISKK